MPDLPASHGARPLLVPTGQLPQLPLNTQELTAEKALNFFAQRRSLIPLANTPKRLPRSSHSGPLRSPGSTPSAFPSHALN